MKIAMYKNDYGDLRIEPAHQMRGVKGYMRISEIEDVKFRVSEQILSIEIAVIQKRMGEDSALCSELKTMLIEGYGDDK